MTDQQKQEIIALRGQNLGYKRIADRLGISVNTVKTFCQRNSLSRTESENFYQFAGKQDLIDSENRGNTVTSEAQRTLENTGFSACSPSVKLVFADQADEGAITDVCRMLLRSQ